MRGIDEGEADHRIGEFRDIVGRIEDLSAQLAAHNDAVMRRLDAIQGIASDNGADEGEGERGPRPKTMTLTTSQPATGMIWPTSSISKEV